MSRLEISRAGIELIESFEGFRAKSARLPKGNFTIGFGHTLTARDGMVVSREQAEELLRWDLGPIEDFVRQNCLTSLTQNQFDAIVSFAFNIGIENFKTSEVLRHLNKGEPISAAIAMSAWRRSHINGLQIVVDALVRRRAMEAALFLDTLGPRPAAPSPIIVPVLDYSASLLAPKPQNIKNVTFEKDDCAPKLGHDNIETSQANAKNESEISVLAMSQEQIDQVVADELVDDELADNTADNGMGPKAIEELKQKMGGEVLHFPFIETQTIVPNEVIADKNDSEKAIIDKVDATGDFLKNSNLNAANETQISAQKPANDKIINRPAAVISPNSEVFNQNLDKTLTSKLPKIKIDPFTIFVIVAGLVAFIAGLYEAIGQGIFANGISNAFSEPGNIFILLTLVIGLVTAIFGIAALFLGDDSE
jgi:GH24 family phage-related lysozyme (muramidase)